MSKTLIAVFIVLGGGFFAALIALIWGISTFNTASTLRNQYEMKVKANEAVFDNTWKKINQSVQVSDEYKNALKEVIVGNANARTMGGAKDGSLMKWVTEAVPNVDSSIYKNLQNIITGSRDEWTANQIALTDIAREYNLMLAKFPSNILLNVLGFKKIDPKIVTSTRTEKAFETGKDDNMGLR